MVDDQHIISENCLPDVVRSIQIAAFADDTKVFKEITTTSDAEQLQEDLSDLVTCKAASLGNLNPSSLSIIWPALNLKLSLPRRISVFTSRITSRGINKSMCNALKPAGSWDMYGETPDSSKALRLDARHTLPL